METAEIGKDDVSIYWDLERGLIAKAEWGELFVEMVLPKGFESWDQAEMAAHFKRFVAPELKTKLHKLKSDTYAKAKIICAESEPLILSEGDVRRMDAADAKRQRKGAKLALLEAPRG